MPEYAYFKFQIKNEKYPLYRKVAAFIFLLNALSFFYFGLQAEPGFQRYLLIAVASLLLIYSLFCFFSKNDKDRSYITLYIISALIWYTEIDAIFAATILLALMVLQIMSHTRLSVTINREGVIINNYTEVSHPWTEISNMVLKDGLLTIDLVSNKMYQLEPDLKEPVIVHKGGSMADVKWTISDDYPELEHAVNNSFLWKDR